MPNNSNERRIYYRFMCKCGTGLDSFQEFLDHVGSSHQIENINFTEIFEQRNGSEWAIKFYWNFTCQCGHKFSSSLCNADLKVNMEGIELLKKYKLSCVRCNDVAQFDNEELLDEFLKERVKQKLIYSFYRENFADCESELHTDKLLEGHKQELCEKCQLLGRYCGSSEF
ncbi:hypothetical protein C1645_770935, partial [Glomus cerebriforme]